MSNTFGKNIAVTLFGESHGECVGAVLDGLPAGTAVSEELIKEKLLLRSPFGEISTGRRETDSFKISSGVFEGHATGAPICITVENTDTRPGDYEDMRHIPRPGHADYTAAVKYGGFGDFRGSGHTGGRITAAVVAASALVCPYLEENGIKIGTHIKYLRGISDREFGDYEEDIKALSEKRFAVLDCGVGERMVEEIKAAANAGDSVGGILETAAVGLPAGLGEPWFDSVEGLLSHAIFSIPGVKGIEFGLGRGFSDALGSEANDGYRYENGNIRITSNNNGGISGGITTGEAVIFRTVVRPTPTISLPQKTVDLKTGENIEMSFGGRHDPAIIHRVRAVVDAMAALVFADILRGGR